jgi:3-phenylpropionate/trans-cinnamate dioxygenase ferredoxin subunit
LSNPAPAFDLSQYRFFAVVPAEELGSGERLFLEVEGNPIVMFNIAGNFYAIGDVCTHDDGPLGDGELDGYQIICPRHGARFDLRTGKVLTFPAVIDAPAYPVRVTDEMLEIGLPKE